MNTAFRTPTAYEEFCTITYRLLLDCLSRPGTIVQLPTVDFLAVPTDLIAGSTTNPFCLAACMSLVDQETSVVLAAAGNWVAEHHPAAAWVHVRTNARRSAASDSAFACLWDVASLALLPSLSHGSLTFPERSATAFCAVDSLSAHGTWELSGPGIQTTKELGISNVTSEQMGYIQASRQSYPLGVDVFLVDATGRCVGLPRSTRIVRSRTS